jgi:hypothetical protein
MTFTVSESPWVTLRQGDPSFQLQGSYTLTNRAGIEITSRCPREYAIIIAQAYERGWLKAVATVPKDDPTYIWETLKR